MSTILRCTTCKKFTLQQRCTCGGTAINIQPLKYTPQDKYTSYRRTAKETERKQQGLL